MAQSDVITTQSNAILAKVVPSEKLIKANAILDRDVKWAFIAGLVPMPVLDVAMIATAQIKLLKSLADHYNTPFNANVAKSIIATLLGSVMPAGFGLGAVGSWVKAIPVIGSFAGIVILPTLASAATYAIGKVFITHFESGGTFLDFDPVTIETKYRKIIATRMSEAEKTAA